MMHDGRKEGTKTHTDAEMMYVYVLWTEMTWVLCVAGRCVVCDAYHVMIIHCTGARQPAHMHTHEYEWGHGRSAVSGGATHYQT